MCSGIGYHGEEEKGKKGGRREGKTDRGEEGERQLGREITFFS